MKSESSKHETPSSLPASWPCTLARSMLVLALVAAVPASGQTPVAQGVFRFPYEDGTQVRVSNSHDVHANRLDLVGQGGGPYQIVAAAAGTVRVVVDNNNTFCPRPPAALSGLGPIGNPVAFDFDGNGRVSTAELQTAVALNVANLAIIQAAAVGVCASYTGPSMCCMRGVESLLPCAATGAPATATCTAGADGDGPNNYIWIEHENGEWTKYSHGPFNGAQVSVGDTVGAGEVIQTQGDVGFATGPHLHFHVAALDSVNDIGATGFAVDDDGVAGINWRHRVPIFCQLGLLEDEEVVTAIACDDLCTSVNRVVNDVFNNSSAQLIQVSNQLTTAATIAPGSGFSARAGQRIVMQPGFHADGGSFFAATIGGCDRPGGIGE
ncbi:MAG: M23 family metallopeptidase [Acidobacteriota bacterium]